jgi:hypothetical protein
MPAEQLFLVRFDAALVDVLGLGGALLDQPDGQHDVEQELQVFRLPVLGHVHGEVRGGDVLSEADLLEALGHLLIVEVGQPGEGLADERGQEEQPEGDAQAVGNHGVAFHRASTPMVIM